MILVSIIQIQNHYPNRISKITRSVTFQRPKQLAIGFNTALFSDINVIQHVVIINQSFQGWLVVTAKPKQVNGSGEPGTDPREHNFQVATS